MSVERRTHICSKVLANLEIFVAKALPITILATGATDAAVLYRKRYGPPSPFYWGKVASIFNRCAHRDSE
jgi:hypothetical protein